MRKNTQEIKVEIIKDEKTIESCVLSYRKLLEVLIENYLELEKRLNSDVDAK